jgi:hypothetical protein
MILNYQSGEEIKIGDRVLMHGDAAEVEFVVVDAADPETEWYFHEFGGGVMIFEPNEPKVFGRIFISASDTEDTEALEFVSRADSPRQSLK